jgi:hypothetical protein
LLGAAEPLLSSTKFPMTALSNSSSKSSSSQGYSATPPGVPLVVAAPLLLPVCDD